jgi:signal transduction histidine kinase
MKTEDLILIFLILQCVLYVILLGTVLRKRRSREWGVGLLIPYLLFSFLWTLAQTYLQLEWPTSLADELLARSLLYGLLFLSLLFLVLTRSFLQSNGAGWGWWALGVAWMAIVVALNEDSLPLPAALQFGQQWSGQQDIGLATIAAGWGFFVGAATLLTAQAFRRTQQPLHRNRITYWFLVLTLTIAGGALFLSENVMLGSAVQLLGICCAAYVVLTHRLPDIRQTARRTISYLIITLLAVVTYTAGFWATQQIFQSVPGYSPLLAGAIMALVLALLFDPVMRRVQQLVDRIISGSRYDASRTMREYSTGISNIPQLDRLATVAVGLISEAMEIRHGALFVVHFEGEGTPQNGHKGRFRLRGVSGMGEDRPPGVLAGTGPVAQFLCHERQPLTQYDIDLLPRFRQTSREERAWLSDLDADVYVPIHAKGEWIGLLTLGPKVSGDRYFEQDLFLLSTLADQTAVALQNARLFDDLETKNQEKERLNQELTMANRELRHMDQIKTDFIHIASHELRTPLTKLQGYAEVMGEMIKARSLTPDDGEQMTKGIRVAVGRLQTVVTTMTDVSKIETETLSLNLLPTPLVSVVIEVRDEWTTALKERRQTLVLKGLADLPAVIADRARLKQAFSHLLQNSIKFTPDGGLIEIRGWLRDEDLPTEEQSVEIVIADNGIGIPRDDLDRIFDKFYRASDVMLHSTGDTKFQGAGPGLGLTIVRGIILAHDGVIWAESPGHDERTCPGSEFHIVLPVQPRHVESAGLQAIIADLYSGSNGSMPDRASALHQGAGYASN